MTAWQIIALTGIVLAWLTSILFIEAWKTVSAAEVLLRQAAKGNTTVAKLFDQEKP